MTPLREPENVTSPEEHAQKAIAPAAPVPSSRRPFDPAPRRGLARRDFVKISENGFGDGHNSYAHSMVWFENHVYVGTSRSNFHMLKVQQAFQDLPVHLWPVEGPDDVRGLYGLDRHAQIWRWGSAADDWRQVFRAPLAAARDEGQVARETGFRAMTIFHGETDPKPALYAATWAVSRSPGSLILRSYDGLTYHPVSCYGMIPGLDITASRVLVPFRDQLFMAPTGTRSVDGKFAINVCGVATIYATRDPATRPWLAACEPSFGDPSNEGVFTLCPFNDQLYAGTFNNGGFQLWRSHCRGDPPYHWTKVIDRGAGRGSLNQIALSLMPFNGALYVGTGIQNGGCDRVNGIGPAGSELLRVHPDDTWDVIVGSPRATPVGRKEPNSGLLPGFGNALNGYFWAMTVHDGWLYLGTMDSTIWLEWLRADAYADGQRRLVEQVGVEAILANEAGCDLWRSADGENWLPVTRNGFGNRYNLGIRNLVSTPHGLFVAIANPFGPRVAVRHGGRWQYADNPRGGLEIWRGRAGDRVAAASTTSAPDGPPAGQAATDPTYAVGAAG
jgi:hypothetical protein